ncbi:MAG: hypothetical protein SGI71_04930 [Verrucomicrobiota bacterium]|nr:hypothetical protein [Verrucomicrobiota bacterium]
MKKTIKFSAIERGEQKSTEEKIKTPEAKPKQEPAVLGSVEKAEPISKSNSDSGKVDLDQLKSTRKNGRLLMILLVVGLGVGLLMGIAFLVSRRPTATADAFPITAYFDNGTSLFGNRYSAVLEVEGQIAWEEKTGRLMAFRDKTSSKIVPLFFPPEVAGQTFQKGQIYHLTFQVKEGGLLYVEKSHKP